MVYAIRRKPTLHGLTMTEVALVFMIIGFVLSALWIAIATVHQNMRVETTMKQLLQMANKTRSVYGVFQNSTIDMSLAGAEGAGMMAKADIVPKDMIDSASSPARVVHAWHGLVTFDSKKTLADGDSFVIGLEDVPPAVCSQLVMRMTGADRDGGLVAAGTPGIVYDVAQMPVGLGAATAACAAASNKVIFTFMLKT